MENGQKHIVDPVQIQTVVGALYMWANIFMFSAQFIHLAEATHTTPRETKFLKTYDKPSPWMQCSRFSLPPPKTENQAH